MSWLVVWCEDGTVHVLPQNDLKDHVGSDSCWCKPFDDEGVTVHNSMDRCEYIERGEMRLS